MATRVGWSPGPASWKDDLSPLGAAEWNYDRAAHLLAHAGFGGSPDEIRALADAGLDRAVRLLVHYESIPNPKMQPFVESGLWDPTLNGFLARRTATRNGCRIRSSSRLTSSSGRSRGGTFTKTLRKP